MGFIKASPKTKTNLVVTSNDGFRCLVKLTKGQIWNVTLSKNGMVEIENDMVSVLIPQEQFLSMFRVIQIQE